ncbi:MAG: hypothetical protein WBX49_01000 [Candidatus Deferrimicrobiaceae bacterium]
MKKFMAIYMPRRKRNPLQENALFIQDIVMEQGNRGIFPDIDIGDISDDAGDFSKVTDGRNPIFDPPGIPVSGGIPGGVGVFPGPTFPRVFPLNSIALISLGIFVVSGMAYSLLSYTGS